MINNKPAETPLKPRRFSSILPTPSPSRTGGELHQTSYLLHLPSYIIHLYRLSKYAIFVSKLAKNVFFAGFAIGNSKIIVTFASVV